MYSNRKTGLVRKPTIEESSTNLDSLENLKVKLGTKIGDT